MYFFANKKVEMQNLTSQDIFCGKLYTMIAMFSWLTNSGWMRCNKQKEKRKQRKSANSTIPQWGKDEPRKPWHNL